MGRIKKVAPPEGGSVQSEPVREAVKQMTGFQSEDEMAASLPENTMTPEPGEDAAPVRVRRPRRTKEEILAARGGAPAVEDDPLMMDPRYKREVEAMRSMGITTTVVSSFEGA